MTATRDPDRLIRAYLAEGRTELSTDAYDAVRSDIENTRQRVVIGPWREPAMPAIARFGVAIAAILIVGIVGLNLSGGSGIGPATPRPTPTATIPPSPTPSGAAYTWPGALVAGTYTTSLVWDVPFTTTFTVPAGWQGMDVELLKDSTVGVQFTLVDNVYTDPCARTPQDPPIGPNVSDLVEGLKESVGGATVTHGEPVAFGGAVGRYIELDLPVTPPCDLGNLSLWHEQAGKALPGKPYGGPDELAVLRHHRLWVLDVVGQRYVIDASRSDDASSADLGEQQAILDSISISRPAQTADCSVSLVDYATRQDLVPPYASTLGATANSMRGPVPDPFPSFAPFARVDFTVAGPDWRASEYATSRPGTNVTPPATASTTGWSTNMTVNGFQGSMLFDAPGLWLAELDGVNPACPHTFLISAAPRP